VCEVLAVQATAQGEPFSLVRVGQDLAMCRAKFPDLLARPIGVQFVEPDRIALLAFEVTRQAVGVYTERHYRLVPPEQLTAEHLRAYRERLE
jgi:hypothetical protein